MSRSPDFDAFLALVHRRRSHRRFAAVPVARADLELLVEAARWAPSNHNRQAWQFVIVDDPAEITRLASIVREGLAVRAAQLPAFAATQIGQMGPYATFFEHAPALILVGWRAPSVVARALTAGLPLPELICGEPISAALAAQNLLLAAEALGLCACLLTAPLLIGEQALAAFPMPDGCRLLCLIAVGHPADPDSPPPAPGRKEFAQIAEFRGPG